MMHGHTYIKLVYCCFSLVHFRLRLFIVYMIYLFYIWICSGQCFIFLCQAQLQEAHSNFSPPEKTFCWKGEITHHQLQTLVCLGIGKNDVITCATENILMLVSGTGFSFYIHLSNIQFKHGSLKLYLRTKCCCEDSGASTLLSSSPNHFTI